MLTFSDVQAAAERIRGHVHRTPVLTSRLLDQVAGAELHFKCELFQRSGAFKARGAFSRLLQLTGQERARGVVAYSSGNHAQAVALAARELGMRATIVMPADAPAAKRAAVEAYGARVVPYDRATESRDEIAARLATEQGGATLLPPFDDDAVIAGQGTAALELCDEVPGLDAIVAPCGGGGLLAGTALAAQGAAPSAAVYGVEPEAGDDVRRSLAAGAVVRIPLPITIADSLQTQATAPRNLALLQALGARVVTVSDAELGAAMAWLASRMKLLVEPGGAAAAAALLHRRIPGLLGKRVGVILSGGNVDLARVSELARLPDRVG